jgi:hypothetical protein
MSRTNPYKKKRRSANKTLLIHGEGQEDCIFLKYLRSLYSRNSSLACKITRGRGGSADSIVIQANRIQGAFNKKVVVLDNDKSRTEMAKARQEAIKNHIEFIEHSPCIEAVFLLILGYRVDVKQKTSAWCKKEFESKYIGSKKRSEEFEYQKIFPKELLDHKRSKIKELSRLICLFENI